MTDEGKPMDLSDAVAEHYRQAAAARRKREARELAAFTENPAMEAAADRLARLRAEEPAARLGAFATEVDAYTRRKARALALRSGWMPDGTPAPDLDDTGDDAA